MTTPGFDPERSPWPTAAWLMVTFTIMALAVGILGQILSPSLVLDAISLWPLAALVIPAIVFGVVGGRRRALAPLMLLTWLLVTIGLHLGSYEGLPSAAASVTMDLADVETGRLVASVPTVDLALSSGDFTVDPEPVGGAGGAPVVERVSGGRSVSLTVTDDPTRSGWFRFGAFGISLPSGVTWDVRIVADVITADLRTVSITGGSVTAERGTITLGRPAASTTLTLAGDLIVSVPEDVAVTAIGAVTVPDGWASEDGEAASPVAGAGWRLVVGSGSVRIVTR